MARTPRRWKSGKFAAGLFNFAQNFSQQIDFGPNLAPDRLIISSEVSITVEYGFYWMASNDSSDAIIVPSPHIGQLLDPGVGARLVSSNIETVLELTEGKRFWNFYFMAEDPPTFLIEGGIAAAPNQ